jgi:tetratricopeptide (TPR) repeat protein
MSVRQLLHITVFLFKILLSYVTLSFSTYAQGPSELAVLSNQVQQLLKVDSEIIDTAAVTILSKKILDNRQHYSNDVLAKVFLLLTRIANNQGDIKKILHYAQSGLLANTLDKKIKFLLTLKLASVFMSQKQYQDLLALMQTVINSDEFSQYTNYQLLSLSYRSVAYSMLNKHHQALNDLKRVELGINHSQLTENIELLTILAMAYHHLGDYQTSLTMQLKILQSRFKMGLMRNIDQTYLYLGYAYLHLQRLDDAYNAFWESKNHAINKKAKINVAHANKGLGIVLTIQKHFDKALAPLREAVGVFKDNNMFDNQTEALVVLAKAKIGAGLNDGAHAHLLEIIQILGGKDISIEYPGFYRMVSEMHYRQADYKSAYLWREKYSFALRTKLVDKKKKASLVHGLPHLALELSRLKVPVEQSKKLAVELAEDNEISSSFFNKYKEQRVIVISLTVLVLLLLFASLGLLFKLRAQTTKPRNDALEKFNTVTTNPMQTKSDYQLAFKKARKFQYAFSVGYLIVENWQELDFHFNKRSIKAVTREIAEVIDEYLMEFDYAGLLTQGEYLLLFEHQSDEQIINKLDKLIQAVNATAFADIGDFSLTMRYSLNKPKFQDIDPYLFLARIGESVSIDKVNPSQTN